MKSFKIICVACITAMAIGYTGTALAEDLVFSDDFSGGFGNNWNIGTNTAVNTSPAVAVVEGRVTWDQKYDYIETVSSFEGALRVEVDLERTLASNQCKDFVIELTDADGASGALRLQYGSISLDTINLGDDPLLDSDEKDFWGVCVEDENGFMAQMDTISPHTGTAVLTYQDGKVKFAFTNLTGNSIETPWKDVGELGPQKIRIWGASRFRFVDAVRVYAQTQPTTPTDCASVDLSNLDIEIPCLLIDGEKYKLKFQYDPSVPGGLHWKLDVNSLMKQ